MQEFCADLHVHTVLSPCAEIEMVPPLIVKTALERGIDLLAVTDHNASANFTAVRKAAQGSTLTVIPGMELQTREEVHLLCLFDTAQQIADWQGIVDSLLPPLENRADFFGDQFVVDETGDFVRRESRLLLVAADIGIDEACRAVADLGGITVPAHIDRQAFSLLANLGFVPPGLEVSAMEISRRVTVEQARRILPQVAAYPLVQNGDAHRLDELLGSTRFTIETPTIREIQLALRCAEGRSFTVRAQAN